MTLLYDADCGFCTRSARLAKRVLRDVAVVALQSVDLAALDVDAGRASAEIPFRDHDGRVTYGADGIASALIHSGGGLAWMGRLMAAQPARQVVGRLYRFVARHRHQLPGGGSACELSPGI